MANEEDPLIQALPPATDYLTYLTLLEYQLTPARLPTLHKLLQDEVLTTNIGWDLVHLLLPMLPQSRECLQDIARLGNPREVILRVSDALMQLQPEDEDTVAVDSEEPEILKDGSDNDSLGETKPPPIHVIKFNTLLTMLSVLHSRIKTKSPSRFLATSLQAVLEAYTSMPTSETTLALLEFLRDVSASKRPAPPPRAPSESSIFRVSQASAPDPEAEINTPAPANSDESLLMKRFLQFALIEVLKSYMLNCTSPMDPGMSWAIRLQEKLHPKTRMPGTESPTDAYVNNKLLRERDMIIAKITALSQDFGLDGKQLLEVVLQSPAHHPPPLDFEEPPKKVEDIPLERHGALLLLAARAAMAELFSSGKITPINVYPELARIFSNFIGGFQSIDEVALEQPQVLLDSLLTLTIFSLQMSTGTPPNEAEFTDFVISLTACTVRQSYSTVRRIPEKVVHNNPSKVARFMVIRTVLEQDRFKSIKDRGIEWLKNEILDAAAAASPDPNLFLNPHYFSVVFPFLFDSSALDLNLSSEIAESWVHFTQNLSPSIHAALNLYYVLISSPTLRSQLQLEKTYIFFRNRFLEPLKSICHVFASDLTQNGGDGKIEATVGEDMAQLGMARSVTMILHLAEQVEDAVNEAFGPSDGELQEPSADDIARVDRIRKETATK